MRSEGRTRSIYRVAQINSYIKGMFAEDFLLRRISVKGEVSNLKYHSSGHIYFTLKDEGSAISAVMFAGNRRGLTFPMKDGDAVVVTGSIEVYERDGKYQLYAAKIEADGAGDLFLRYEKLKKELEETGMFAPEYKREIPRYARRIGVVTAPTGAAVQDIKNIAHRRNPYLTVILYPAKVQGEGAAESIVAGIEALDELGLDVLIVGRGGGSIEDLWAFNEEPVVRAVFEARTPIISAVGHETDTTLTDYAADLRAPTPSAAAELAVFDVRQTLLAIEDLHRDLDRAMERRLRQEKERLRALSLSLRANGPMQRFAARAAYARELRGKLDAAFLQILNERKARLAATAGALHALSPLQKMSLGYAYVTDEKGHAKRSIKDVTVGEALTLTMTDGTARAVVQSKEVRE